MQIETERIITRILKEKMMNEEDVIDLLKKTEKNGEDVWIGGGWGACRASNETAQ